MLIQFLNQKTWEMSYTSGKHDIVGTHLYETRDNQIHICYRSGDLGNQHVAKRMVLDS